MPSCTSCFAGLLSRGDIEASPMTDMPPPAPAMSRDQGADGAGELAGPHGRRADGTLVSQGGRRSPSLDSHRPTPQRGAWHEL